MTIGYSRETITTAIVGAWVVWLFCINVSTFFLPTTDLVKKAKRNKRLMIQKDFYECKAMWFISAFIHIFFWLVFFLLSFTTARHLMLINFVMAIVAGWTAKQILAEAEARRKKLNGVVK